jgi:hypothetical protein
VQSPGSDAEVRTLRVKPGTLSGKKTSMLKFSLALKKNTLDYYDGQAVSHQLG